MPVASKELDLLRWRQVGLRVHPEVRKALKVSAAQAGETMEHTLHRILVREFRRRNQLPESFREGDDAVTVTS
jgi:hypothetical protein